MTEVKFTSEIDVELINSCGGDYSIAAAAKVSVCGQDAKKWADPEHQEHIEGLINYLVAQKHVSTLEHSMLTFFIHVPIFIMREIVRHRTISVDEMSLNEASARYSVLEPVFWLPVKDRKMKPVENYKPSRPVFEAIEEDKYNRLIERMKDSYRQAYANYEASLADGVAREVARAVLPVGIYTSCWITTNPRNLLHFISLRTHEPNAAFVSYPQAEIEEVARACELVLAKGWPLLYKAFLKAGRCL